MYTVTVDRYGFGPITTSYDSARAALDAWARATPRNGPTGPIDSRELMAAGQPVWPEELAASLGLRPMCRNSESEEGRRTCAWSEHPDPAGQSAEFKKLADQAGAEATRPGRERLSIESEWEYEWDLRREAAYKKNCAEQAEEFGRLAAAWKRATI